MAGGHMGAPRLLVGVPFTAGDVGALLRAWVIWEYFPPHAAPLAHGHASTSGLLLLFNGRCGESEGNLCATIRRKLRSADGKKARGGFDHVYVRDARLEGRADKYDKRRTSAAWTMGPNNLFQQLLLQSRQLNYHHLLQLECDVLPYRRGWVDRALLLATTSDAWVIGSPLMSNCTRDDQTGRCERSLPERFAEHINGNAIYAAGDRNFVQYARNTRKGASGKLPFDLALHSLRGQYDQPTRRQLAHRFQHSSFVLNLGTELPSSIAALHDSYPNSFLVHCSAFLSLSEEQLLRFFGIGEAGVAGPAGLPAALTPLPEGRLQGTAGLDLAPLREAASGIGTALVAFVAGDRYADLCRNFIHHARAAGVSNLALVGLDSQSVALLRSLGVRTVDASGLVQIPKSGSDQFGSAAFFAVNGARYKALQGMLGAGISLFVVDLDVIILLNPFRWLSTAQGGAELASQHDILVQSDARDGVSQLEHDPVLVRQRLGLESSAGWAYVNGGTFFCRPTEATRSLFKRLWDTLAAAATAPNEQDLLNKHLAAGAVRWASLPPSLFPNGYVYFYRPIPSMTSPVLLHVNWINGVQEKVYHMREASLWSPYTDDSKSGKPLAPRRPQAATWGSPCGRLLSVAETAADESDGALLGFDVHWRSLRDALAIAELLNRTLVLPRLPVVPGRDAPSSRTLAHHFDYARFAAHFPRHTTVGEAAHCREQLGGQPARVHLDVERAKEQRPSDGFEVVHLGRVESASKSDVQLQRVLARFAQASELQLWASYRRFRGRFSNSAQQRAFAVRVNRGLRLAPRLAVVAHHVRIAIVSAVGKYECVDPTSATEFAELLNQPLGDSTPSSSRALPPPTAMSLLRLAASSSGRTRSHVLVVGREVAGSPSLLSFAWEVFGGRVLSIDDFIPRWFVANYDTVNTNRTYARDLIEQVVCANADVFRGNLASPSTHAICRRRMTSSRHRRQFPEAGLTGKSRACEDILGRTLLTKGGVSYR